MENGKLIDPLTQDSVDARIPTWRQTHIYHIPTYFNLEERIAGRKNYPFLFQTAHTIFFVYAEELEHYARKFDRIKIKFLTALQYAEHLEDFHEETRTS